MTNTPSPDDQILKMLAGATFGANSKLILPSGAKLSSEEAQAFTAALAPASRETTRVRTAMAGKRSCFYVDESMETPEGFIPSMVTEGEPGHSPLVGSGKFATPWYWGKDIETARRIAVECNAKLGVSEDDAREIVASSMAAARIEKTR